MADEEAPETEAEKVNRWLVGQFLDLGFPPSMADDLVAEKADWREAKRILRLQPPGGFPWVYQHLMP